MQWVSSATSPCKEVSAERKLGLRSNHFLPFVLLFQALFVIMALPALPTIRDLIKLFGLRAKQELSQNFILDLNVTEKIIERTARHTGHFVTKTVLEVGPGPGSLTRSILNAGCKNLVVVEKDKRFMGAMAMLQEALPEGKSLSVINGDILEVNEKELLTRINAPKREWSDPSDVVVVGNLPFSISTPLLLKWIRQIPLREGAFAFGRSPMALMFQKELADRICAQPGSREFNRLSVMVQHCCHASILYKVGSKNFVPAPKVDAAMVYLEPRVDPILDVDLKALEQLCRLGFQQKRKSIGNSIKMVHVDAKVLLELAGIDPSKRPEEVSVRDWCLLANIYRKSKFYEELPSKFYDNYVTSADPGLEEE